MNFLDGEINLLLGANVAGFLMTDNTFKLNSGLIVKLNLAIL